MRDLRADLNAGRNLVGFFSNLPDPALVEMGGWAGFDFVVVDNEHGPLAWTDVENLIRAGEAAGVPVLVRVVAPDDHILLKALDRGPAGVHVPQVETAAEAEAIVRACRFPPLGSRGAAFTPRWAHHGLGGGRAALERANAGTFIAVHVETRRGVDHIAEILRVPGIDQTYIGPTDLSVSLGHPGDADHPEVREAMDEVLRRCREAGRPCGCHASDPAGVAARFAWGARYVGVSVQSLLGRALRETVAARPGGPAGV